MVRNSILLDKKGKFGIIWYKLKNWRVMTMKFRKVKTEIEGVYIIEPTLFGDERGFFMETWNHEEFKKIGLDVNFVQDNHSKSIRGVLRGLHLQTKHSQGKLIRVVKGAIYDVAVDLREGSETYGKWIGVELSRDNHRMCYIPEGFAHGFLALDNENEIIYKCTDVYKPQYELGIAWDDRDLGVDWALDRYRIDRDLLILSEKDRKNISFNEYQHGYFGEKVMILGAHGQLGREFQRYFDEKKIRYVAFGHNDLDVRDIHRIEEEAIKNRVTGIINCAGYNNVDKAEVERDVCCEVNGYAPLGIAGICKKLGIFFVTYSTDYVFDGEKDTPYTEDDIPNPISLYGQSKLMGEHALEYNRTLVIRPSWIFGSLNDNFVKKVIGWAEEKHEVRVVDDQVSAPTYTKDLVNFTWSMIEKDIYGLYHFSNFGECSKYDEVKYVLGKTGGVDKLERAKSEDFKPLAKRPKYSKLDSRKAESVVGPIPHWKDGIDRFLKEIK